MTAVGVNYVPWLIRGGTFMKEKGVAVYKLPERLEIVEIIPRNPVGKILKKELREDIKRELGT